MVRKLKVYQTSQGFFDLAIAAPSMKAALEAWGANSNLFHQGFAREVSDQATIKAALAKPGIVLKRPVGTSEPFGETAHLPTERQMTGRSRRSETSAGKTRRSPDRPVDDKTARKAAQIYEKEERQREISRRKEKATRAKERGATSAHG
jgi:colicin import membrane protein